MGSIAQRPESKALQRAREWAAGRLIQLGLANGGDGSSACFQQVGVSSLSSVQHDVATNTTPRKSGRSPKRALDITISGARSIRNDEPPLKRRRGRPPTIGTGGINGGLQR